MMKRLILLAFLLALLSTVGAQRLSVVSFRHKVTTSVGAGNRRLDANNKPTALVKVQVMDDISKVTDAYHVGNIEKKTSVEKWIFFLSGTKRLTLHFEHHYPLEVNLSDWGIDELVGNHVYELLLEPKGESEPDVSHVTEPVPQTSDDTKVFDFVDQMPSFPGGTSSLIQYLSTQIKYPVVAEENGIEGKVIVSFIVNTDGSITDVRVARSVDPSLDKEAVRVIRSMPKWKPGMQKGKVVRVRYTVPVTFRLQPSDDPQTNDQPSNSRSDKTDADSDNEPIYEKADVLPSYPGGEEQFRSITSKVIAYPRLAEDNNVDGVVQMNSVQGKSSVTTYGNNADNVSKMCNDLFNNAVKDGLKKIPRFTPATIDGHPVRFRMMLVAVFGAGKNDVPPSPNTKCVYIRGKNCVENLYTEDKKPYKDMHLYLLGNEYWVSGINKRISVLSNEDITTISKKSKDVADDILKKFGEKNGGDVVYDLTSFKAYKNINRPLLNTPNGLDEYMKEHLSKSTEKVSVVVSFIVETDGRISCPVVERGNDLKAVKNVINCLRKTKGWQPALKDGIPVRSRISHFFSYKTVVTTVQRSIPVYSPRPRSNNDLQRRRGF